MQKWIKKAAHRLAAAQNLDIEREAVIAYGMLAICQMVIILLGAVLLGLLTGALPECLVLYAVVGTLRKCTGGVHASTMLGCILVSLLTIGGMALLGRYVLAPLLPPAAMAACLAVYLPVFLVLYRRVPVDSPNKPITNPDKIGRLRRASFSYAAVCLVLNAGMAVALLLWNPPLAARLHLALLLAVLWQTFTLTAPAAYLARCCRGKV